MDATPEAEGVAADRGEEGPYCGIDSPGEAFRGVGAAFAGEGVHDADDVVDRGCFCHADVAVSQ